MGLVIRFVWLSGNWRCIIIHCDNNVSIFKWNTTASKRNL